MNSSGFSGISVMRLALLVTVGGGIGALCRYLLQVAIVGRFGAGILALFVINVTGAFAVGFINALAEQHTVVSPDVRLLLTTGFLGGYTTFSSWMYESLGLIMTGEYPRAALNVMGSALVGLVAVMLGVMLGRTM